MKSRKNFWLCASAIVGALTLSGCGASTVGLADAPRLVVTPLSELPLPTGLEDGDPVRPYLLGPLDKVSVRVFDEEGVSGSYTLDGSGAISVPLAGEVRIGGLSPAEAAGVISRALDNVLYDPQVIVNLEEAVSQTVQVDGAVGKSDLYPIAGRTTLLQIISKAGGTDEFAVIEKVVVFRTVGDTKYAAVYSLKDIRQGARSDPEVFAGDIVLVGDSRARRLYRDILQGIPLIYSFRR